MWSKGKRHDRHQAEHRELVGTGADATPASPPTLADVAAAGGSGAGELVKMDLGAAGSDGASSSGGGGAQVVDVPGDGGSSGGGGAGSNKQRRCLHRVRTKAWWQGFFDSNVYHNTVIILVLLDLSTIAIDLGFMLAHCPEPHLLPPVEMLLEVLTWLSVGILCVFIVEFAAQALCFGLRWFTKPANVLDVTVVVASLVLELVLRSTDLREVVALLIVFRLWRLVRVIHSTEEIMHIEHGKRFEHVEKELKAKKKEAAQLRAQLAQAHAQLAAANARLLEAAGAAAAGAAPAGPAGGPVARF